MLLAEFLRDLAGAQLLERVEIPFEPRPTPRPRVSKFGAHYPKPYADWMKQAQAALRKGRLGLEPDFPLLVIVDQVCTKARTSKRTYPQGDCDNHAKGPLDVITKVTGYWHDDDQITTLIVRKRYAGPDEKPKTILEIYAP